MSFLTDGEKNECYGCGACVSACPHNCIHMQEDEEGFRYPNVDRDRCRNCGLCEKVCPKGFAHYLDASGIRAYYGINKNRKTVEGSSSGGAFTALCRQLISSGYTVYGAVMDGDLKVKHVSASDMNGCALFCKSKYVQSDLQNCYREIAGLLADGKRVAFSGVPCQCAALRKYLMQKNLKGEELILISVLCHGVPSQQLFDRYIEETAESRGKKVTGYEFRNKKERDGKADSRSARIIYSDNSDEILIKEKDPYLKGYYKRLFLRPSCGTCEFARRDRVADITLADNWGLEELSVCFDTSLGASVIMAAGDKAIELISHIGEDFEFTDLDTETALKAQSITSKPVYMHENRKRFFGMLRHFSFYASVEKSARPPIKRIIRILIEEGKKRTGLKDVKGEK